ncbi:MAG: class I adenylate-forming enzyme family protein [Hyphomicrobiales bacterium]
MPDENVIMDRVPEQFSLARHCLARGVRRSPDKVALIVCKSAQPSDAEIWTYSEIEDAILRIAEGLNSYGLANGSRVFLRMRNSVDYALMFLGANAAGLVPIPASSQLTEEEVAFMAEDADIAAIAYTSDLALPELPNNIVPLNQSHIDDLKTHTRGTYADTSAEDPAFLIYTSGTSGRPKGVLHAQRVLWGRRPMYQGWYGINSDDVMLHTGAFNWTYTLGTGLMDPWVNGATSIVYTGAPDPTIWPQLAQQYKATIIASVPTLYRQIQKYNKISHDSFPALRHGLTAGEPLPLDVADSWHQATGLNLYEALGMSEISTYISSAPDIPTKRGSPGKPQPARQVAILPADAKSDVAPTPLPAGETGLLAVHRSDPGLMLGYWKRPKEETQVLFGEWFAGGDLAQIDEDGYVWFDGRNDDLMNAMGFRVSPIEVEKILELHPSVGEVAVAERSVRADVSVIAAYIVPAEGCEVKTESLVSYAAEHLAAYKCPREILVVDRLPRTTNGKVMRKALQSL